MKFCAIINFGVKLLLLPLILIFLMCDSHLRDQRRVCPEPPPGMVCVPGGKTIIGRAPKDQQEQQSGSRVVAESPEGMVAVSDEKTIVSMVPKDRQEQWSDSRVTAEAPDGMVAVPGGKTVAGREPAGAGKRNPGSRWVYEKWDNETSRVEIGNDTPVYELELSTFFIDKYEVTNAEYDKCVKAGHCTRFKNFRHHLYNGFRGPDQPAVPVSWEMAFNYCKWAGKRLPTEAEWETVARGAREATKYPWGDDKPDCTKANYRGCGKPGTDSTKNVGSYPAGHFGVFDMAGNGYEWVHDWASESRAKCGAPCVGKDPKGPCNGRYPCSGQTKKVLRGGSFWWPAVYMTGTARRLEQVNSGGNRLSFRCASSTPYLTKAPGWMIVDPPAALTSPKPLSEEQKKIMSSIKFDQLDTPLCNEVAWSKVDCKDPLTYIKSNESQHYLLMPYVKNLGGAYFGVAADANYSFIAYARSRWAFLMDYDITIVRLHRMLRALILKSNSPGEFINLFRPHNSSRAEKIIIDTYPDDPKIVRTVAVYRHNREKLLSYYYQKSQPNARFGDFGWLRNPEAFAYIKLMYEQGRIAIVEGNLLRGGAMRSIAETAKKLGTVLRIYYPSNAEEMWHRFPDVYRENLRQMPFDERSIAIRTIWASTYPRGRTQRFWHRMVGGIYWHYVVHGALDYQQKIQYPEYDEVDAWKSERIPMDSKLLSIINLPGKLPKLSVDWAKCEE